MSDLGVFGLVASTIAMAQIITAVIAWRLNRVSVADVTWGLGFVAVALVSAVAGDGTD